jgi:hypothetical protein
MHQQPVVPKAMHMAWHSKHIIAMPRSCSYLLLCHLALLLLACPPECQTWAEQPMIENTFLIENLGGMYRLC